MTQQTEYNLEIPVNASPNLLYSYISTDSGLSDWFAEKVVITDGKYHFSWEHSEETAILVDSKTEDFVRFKWENDEEEDTFFELKIKEDKLTKDVFLLITDFAEADEVEDSKKLWESQVNDLIQVIGGN